MSDIENIANVDYEIGSVSENPQQHLTTLIIQVLQQDPRPAQHARKGDYREYGMLLYHYNVRWRETDQGAEVVSVREMDSLEQPTWKR